MSRRTLFFFSPHLSLILNIYIYIYIYIFFVFVLVLIGHFYKEILFRVALLIGHKLPLLVPHRSADQEMEKDPETKWGVRNFMGSQTERYLRN
jgi:hypothetical protein